ncbi:MAG TPA: hypothetical protein PK147_00800 [Saprospiraceae bacterium]|nr:hypothetical protein [Saprospiraceae bacterium]MCB9328795.1 hypothetical protein [Lewinellaceae bacterium]HPK09928.1 hypothetical protein [Saprospiraceae bacterium]HPQ20353.1 hypothetical protein [Saprospiraceae bacterium]
MKQLVIFLFCMAFLFIISSSISSCKTGEGCGLEEKYAPATDKDGNLKMTKRKKAKMF